jgi:cutinase
MDRMPWPRTWNRVAALLCVGLLAAGCGLVDLEAVAADEQAPERLSAVAGAVDTSSADCTDVRLLVARGTREPGALGVIVGDPLYLALQERVDSASAAPVDYPAASITLSGVQEGSEDVIHQLTEQVEACPAQQVVLAGYSQGAMVIVTALEGMPTDLADRVAAVVLFGNPFRARGTGDFADRTIDVCATSDTICNAGAGNGTGFGHLSYTSDVDRAAQFIAEQVGS